MTNKDLIPALMELPQDVQFGCCILNVKNLKDFRRLILFCGAEVQINRSKFSDTSGIDWVFAWFYTEDGSMQFRWKGTVSGYEVRWCGFDGEERINYFQKLEDAQMVFKELLEEDYDGVMLLPGVDGVPE